MARITDGDDFGCSSELPLLCAPEDQRQIEIDNVLSLGEFSLKIACEWDGEYFFTPDLVCQFNHIVMQGIYASAGEYRRVFRAPHGLDPPSWKKIPELIMGMCEYANSHADNGFHVGAYILWRTNWIHPFHDGNGRTARELCNLAVLVHTGETWGKLSQPFWPRTEKNTWRGFWRLIEQSIVRLNRTSVGCSPYLKGCISTITATSPMTVVDGKQVDINRFN